MAEMPLINISALLLEKEEMNAGVVQQLRTGLSEAPTQFLVLRSAVEKLEGHLETGKGDPTKIRLKLGVACHLVGRMDRAVEMLLGLRGGLAQFYLALSLTEMGRYQDALLALDEAAKLNYAAAEVQLHRAAAHRGLGRFDEAQNILDALDNYVRKTAEYRYQMGSLMLARGDKLPAIEQFEKAVEVDGRHQATLFQLAFYNDLMGNDEEAINYYERCLRLPPPRGGALLNLGILYEDNGQYEKAVYCYDQVLVGQPNHARAKLFRLDAAASREQFVDEDAERRSDYNRAVLDLPVTDFELSVRSRNCLKRMNIRTLRDLTLISEPQLLASKNFGETSLTEITAIMSMKGLRIGQGVEQSTKKSHPSFINAEDLSPQEQALHNKPLSELNFSVRARKCMTRLGINTVGDLINRTGDELLDCKNFGVTSLVEVRNKLKELGQKLRGD